ncbi:MAG: hypothetical protein CR991_02100 [Proteobacteria bacterium]|nr:MAG: hypothetical protein CR991_02100 [Pseudomonadota bacterium]
MSDFLDKLGEWASDFIIWLLDKLLSAGVSILESIPAPDWMANINNYSNAIPPEVIFWVAPLNFPEGLAIIMSAYLLKFLIKRIPFIGG